MQKINFSLDNLQNVVFFLIALLIVFVDQLTKTWIRANLTIGQSLFDIGFLRITHISNTGAAFGLFQDQSSILTIIAFIGAIVIVLYALLSPCYLRIINNMQGKVALGLVLGGTVGNLVDRISLGHVTDFIDFKIWPTFNVADSAVTVGIIIFAYTAFQTYTVGKRQHGND